MNALSTGDITYHDLPDGGWITTADKSNKKTAVRIAKGVAQGLVCDYDLSVTPTSDTNIEVSVAIRLPYKFVVTFVGDTVRGTWAIKKDSLVSDTPDVMSAAMRAKKCNGVCIATCIGLALWRVLPCLKCAKDINCWAKCLVEPSVNLVFCILKCCK